jgi:hypothetical protein
MQKAEKVQGREGVRHAEGRESAKKAARQGKARQGKTRQGKTRQGKPSQAKARQGKARRGKARKGKPKQGKASQGGGCTSITVFSMKSSIVMETSWIAGVSTIMPSGAVSMAAPCPFILRRKDGGANSSYKECYEHATIVLFECY